LVVEARVPWALGAGGGRGPAGRRDPPRRVLRVLRARVLPGAGEARGTIRFA